MADHPGERNDVEVGAPKTWAAGLPGVAVALRTSVEEMGVGRTVRALARLNQVDGFDCPGCAWPEHPDRPAAGRPGRSHAEFCENGAKAVAEEATRRRADPAFFAAHPVSELRTWSDHDLGKAGRLTTPLRYDNASDRYRPITWDEAFALAADGLTALSTPDAAAFYTSGRASNEAAFAWQLLARRFGTNNLPDCSNLCHESSGVALTQTIGIGKGTVTLDDVESADLLLVMGQNPATNHPRMLTSLEAAKRRGATIVAVNPLPEAGLLAFRNPQTVRGVVGTGTALADVHLPVALNGDLALLRAVNRLLLDADEAAPERGIVDHDFIATHAVGFGEYRTAARAADLDALVAESGITVAQVRDLAERVGRTERIVVCWAMGLTQHRNAVATIREIVNLLLLRGAIGKPGAGACPVRGHSNVQGDRTVGINERPPAWFLDALGAELGFEPPRADGRDVVDTIRGVRDGTVQALLALGGNLLSAGPDTAVTTAALGSAALTVHVATKPNRSHLHPGRVGLLLPCLGRTEHDGQASGPQRVTVEDSMGLVHASVGRLAPPGPEVRSEVAIVCGLARALLGEDQPWLGYQADYATIRSSIEAVVPGFAPFEERLDQPGSFALPNAPRDARRFPTTVGKARFTVNVEPPARAPAGRLVLQTLRSHDQFNTTVYGLDDRYRGIHGGREVVFAHEADLANAGLADGDRCDVVAEAPDGDHRRLVGVRAVAYPVPLGTCAAYFPEANVLVPLDHVALESNTPAYKSIIVRLEPAAP